MTHVVELNILMRTRQSVTSRTILAGTMSYNVKKGSKSYHIEAKLTGGTKNETQDIMTNMAEGRYTLRMNGPRDLDRRISNPYAL